MEGHLRKELDKSNGFNFKACTITIPLRPFMLISEPEIDEIITTVKDQILI